MLYTLFFKRLPFENMAPVLHIILKFFEFQRSSRYTRWGQQCTNHHWYLAAAGSNTVLAKMPNSMNVRTCEFLFFFCSSGGSWNVSALSPTRGKHLNIIIIIIINTVTDFKGTVSQQTAGSNEVANDLFFFSDTIASITFGEPVFNSSSQYAVHQYCSVQHYVDLWHQI